MVVRLRNVGFTLVGSLLLSAGCGPKQRGPAPYQQDPFGLTDDREGHDPDSSVLVGMAEDREGRYGDSSVRGNILRLDGRSIRFVKEKPVDAGCHVVEVEVEYEITRPDKAPCLAFEPFGGCDRVSTYESGLRHFAIPMKPGRRYELSARINEDGAWVYFVEVDAELGTVARFVPVPPGTTACAPGIAL